jgi:hypothetical protein
VGFGRRGSCGGAGGVWQRQQGVDSDTWWWVAQVGVENRGGADCCSGGARTGEGGRAGVRRRGSQGSEYQMLRLDTD